MYAVKNKYYKHSKLDEQCFRRILELFAMDLTAVQCANLTGVNVRSVNTIFLKLRDRFAQWSESNASGTPGLNAQLSSGALITGTATGTATDTATDTGTSGNPVAQSRQPSSRQPSTVASIDSIDRPNSGIIGVRLFIRSDQVYCACLLYTSPSPRDGLLSRMPSSA